MTVSNRTLVKIAAWGGVILSTTGFYLQFRLTHNVKEAEFYKPALKTLRMHPGAIFYLDLKAAVSRMEKMQKFDGDPKEKFFYHNTLLCLVQALQGKNVTVDLRNDSYICGNIATVDGFMNISFTNAVYCDPQGNEYKFENLFVHGRNIRYVHIPESMEIVSTIKKELSGNRRKPVDRSGIENSRKVKKAMKQHLETVAMLGTKTTKKD